MHELLLSAVKQLAAPADEQAAVLKASGAHVDELALDFDAQPRHDVPQDVRVKLDRLDALLGQMSGETNAELWTYEALSGPEWRAVRGLAREVLSSRWRPAGRPQDERQLGFRVTAFA